MEMVMVSRLPLVLEEGVIVEETGQEAAAVEALQENSHPLEGAGEEAPDQMEPRRKAT